MTDKKAPSTSKFHRVCVFCGSSSGNKECYKQAAIEVGKELVARNLDLIYGGGSIGLMGLVSKVVHSGGRNVTGIIPKTMIGRERTGETIGELIPVTTMHERKAEMARLSDCFIALPGGFGTLEELLEVITWAQLGIHNKPVGLLNVDGYYDLLLRFADKAVEEGFIKGGQRDLFVSATNAKELVEKMEEYVPDESVAKYMREWEEDQQKQGSPAVGLKVLLADIIQPATEFIVCKRRFNVVNHRVFCYWQMTLSTFGRSSFPDRCQNIKDLTVNPNYLGKL